MKRTLLTGAALLVFLPALLGANKGCAPAKASYAGLALTEARVLNVTIDPGTMTPMVLLTDLEGSSILPIAIGSNEALAIASVLEHVSFPRPMTHDLIERILSEVNTRVVKVIVTDLRDDTFYAVIILKYKGRELALDSRPSDAIAVAVRVNAPIYISSELLRTRGIREGVTEL